MFRSILLLTISAWFCHAENVLFDYYSATPATEELKQYYKSVNQLENCTTTIALPCDPNDWRRTDGSCNNLKYPSRGTYFNPMYRMLPAHFHDGYHARRAKSGNELPSQRQVRLHLMKVGKSVHPDFTLNLPYYGVYTFLDIGSLHDVENMIIYNTQCCEKEHYNDYVCASNFLEEDDPVHRFDGIRCLNMTRPVYVQDFKCTEDPVPSPIAQATPSFDLSQIYNVLNKGDGPMRTFINGQLEVEIENGKIWPPNGQFETCLTNEGDESRCFKFHRNALLPMNLFSVWFVRLHNYVANKLVEVNPCWDDDTLFRTAREICIAWSQQMYLYEWMDAVIGHENLLKSGLISESPKCRKTYDDTCYPKVALEYNLFLRWFHVIQETRQKMYDTEGHYLFEYPIVNATFRTGLLAKGQYMEQFTQGCFRQPTSDFDYSVDYDIVEQGAGGVHRAVDALTSDLNKNRLFGLAPYVDYIYECTGIKIKCFSDFAKYGFMTSRNVALLEGIYEHHEDVDAFAGMWLAKPMKGGKIPEILACVLTKFLRQAQRCDRHYYESCDRPHAFTEEQMIEIRKATLALMQCAVGDGVSEIQPKAFLNISPKNPLTPCSEIPQINFGAFADPTCNCE